MEKVQAIISQQDPSKYLNIKSKFSLVYNGSIPLAVGIIGFLFAYAVQQFFSGRQSKKNLIEQLEKEYVIAVDNLLVTYLLLDLFKKNRMELIKTQSGQIKQNDIATLVKVNAYIRKLEKDTKHVPDKVLVKWSNIKNTVFSLKVSEQPPKPILEYNLKELVINCLHLLEWIAEIIKGKSKGKIDYLKSLKDLGFYNRAETIRKRRFKP